MFSKVTGKRKNMMLFLTGIILLALTTCVGMGPADTATVTDFTEFNESKDKAVRALKDRLTLNGTVNLSEGHFLLRSYETEDFAVKDTAFVYDNALCAMAFISEGMQAEAEEILDSFVFASAHDRYKAGRIRNAYACGRIDDGVGDAVVIKMPGWWDIQAASWFEDRYQVGCNVGNTSFAVLAMLDYDRRFETDRYLNTACSLMEWVLEECQDGTPGFTAGFEGWPEGDGTSLYRLTYKSTEHNIDAYAVFCRLYELTDDKRYADAAESALSFVKRMYDSKTKSFRIGTGNDGVTVESDNMVLDVQVWSGLAMSEVFPDSLKALGMARSMKTPEGGYPFTFSDSKGAFWSEGTAFTALGLRLSRQESESAEALRALMTLQADNGLFHAASHTTVSTGIDLFTGDPWEYSTDLHIAPTAWYVLAVNGYNPYI